MPRFGLTSDSSPMDGNCVGDEMFVKQVQRTVVLLLVGILKVRVQRQRMPRCIERRGGLSSGRHVGSVPFGVRIPAAGVVVATGENDGLVGYFIFLYKLFGRQMLDRFPSHCFNVGPFGGNF